MEDIKKLISVYKAAKFQPWQKKYLKLCKKYGKCFENKFKLRFKHALHTYYGVSPGDAIDIQILKMLCKDSAQAALDSHKVTTIHEIYDSNSNFKYCFDRDSLTSTEKFYLQKDLNIFSTLSDIIDCRLCKKFVVLIPTNASTRIVCRIDKWIEIVNSPLVGGFKNLFAATCIHEVTKSCGMLAATINYSNILTMYECKHKTSLTMILINTCLLNKQTEKICSLTRNGTMKRRDFLTRSCFETCKQFLHKANINNEKDELNENYARIIMQLPPLVGTNFANFVIKKKKE